MFSLNRPPTGPFQTNRLGRERQRVGQSQSPADRPISNADAVRSGFDKVVNQSQSPADRPISNIGM